MRLLNIVFGLFVIPAACANHQTIVKSTTSTETHCSTKYTSTAVHFAVPTETITKIEHEKPSYTTSTSYPVTTVTAKAYTSTKIVKHVTTVTVTHKSGEVTTTLTLFTTKTDSTQVLSKSTSSTTSTYTVTSTSTVPTPSGFLPIDSTRFGVFPKNKRSQSMRTQKSEKRNQADGKELNAKSYELCVDCTKELIIKTTTTIIHIGATRTVTKPASTAHVTSTTTVKSTSTVIKAPHTISKSTTSTIKTTITHSSTTTVTQTITAYATTIETSYAACATNNVIGPDLSKGGITDIVPAGLWSALNLPDVASAEACCAFCQTTAFCEGSFYAWQTRTCDLVLATECTTQRSNVGNFFVDAGTLGKYIASNGPCGQWVETDA